MKISIEKAIRDTFTVENFCDEYRTYKAIKTDTLLDSLPTKIPIGSDGVNQKHFDKNLKRIATATCKRIHSGKYFFKPYREVEVSKKPHLTLEQARSAGEIRNLSIATIRDVITQRLLYRAIEPFAEQIFQQIPVTVSYGYRPGLSAPMAARKISDYVKDGYSSILDADIEKFFDSIPHDRLLKTIDKAFNNTFTTNILKRFFCTGSIPHSFYKGDPKRFYKQRYLPVKRGKGIPQGGVLSGLLANLYLHNFDIFVRELKNEFDIKYVRYADDFVILARNSLIMPTIRDRVTMHLSGMGLTVHKRKDKTKIVDTNKEQLEFVGFAISPKSVRVRRTNVIRFKSRVKEILSKWQEPRKHKFTQKSLNYKIYGNEFDIKVCGNCSLPQPKRSWMAFFLTVTDVRQLRALDTWIRKEFFKRYYQLSGRRFTNKMTIGSLERLYYQYRKEARRSKQYCNCSAVEYIEGLQQPGTPLNLVSSVKY